MKESYGEGVANHPGPEPCEGSRKAALEALVRGICRQGIELRNNIPGCSWCRSPRRQYGCARKRECAEVLRSLRPQACRETPSARTGRPRRRPPSSWADRRENAMSGKSLMHGGGESSDCIVPTKCANKGGETPAERTEGRRSAEETSRHGPMLDTEPENTGAIQCRGNACSWRTAGRGALRGGNRVR